MSPTDNRHLGPSMEEARAVPAPSPVPHTTPPARVGVPPLQPAATVSVVGRADALPVIQEFQRTMAQIIESQERVMLAYLGGAPAAAAPALSP